MGVSLVNSRGEASPQAISSGAVLALAALVPIDVCDASVHSCDVALLDLSASGWRCYGASWRLPRPGSHWSADVSFQDTPAEDGPNSGLRPRLPSTSLYGGGRLKPL
jgi:hypothetical protein